mmetsp:Transcript_27367/g.80152  ORF Transcript_27367/g.80152 Transcript_27367/m.80152 type:complete len:286 (+) Transcript_27367:316-1173(+)
MAAAAALSLSLLRRGARDVARDELLRQRRLKGKDGGAPAAALQRHALPHALLAERTQALLLERPREVDACLAADRGVPAARRRALPTAHLAVRLLHLQHPLLRRRRALVVADKTVGVQVHHELAVRFLHVARARVGSDAQHLRRLGTPLRPAEEPVVHMRLEGVEVLVGVFDRRTVELPHASERLARGLEHDLDVAADGARYQRPGLVLHATLDGDDRDRHPVCKLLGARRAHRDRVLGERLGRLLVLGRVLLAVVLLAILCLRGRRRGLARLLLELLVVRHRLL